MTNLDSFLITTGRTLAQLQLYTADHPAVKDALREARRQLEEALASASEIVLGLHENRLVVNGHPVSGAAEAASRPFLHLFEHLGIHSLVFTVGAGEKDLAAFFALAFDATAKKEKPDPADFLAARGVSHIQVNLAKYAMIGEDEAVGREGDEAPPSDKELMAQLRELSLDALLKQLVSRAVSHATDREEVLVRARALIGKEVEAVVSKAAQQFEQEKQQIVSQMERGEQVVDTVTDGVVVVDPSGNVLMMNPTAEQIYGVNLGECLGKPLWGGLREEQMISLARDLESARERPVTKEIEVRAAEETRKTLRASSAAVKDVEGRLVGMVSVLSDVTKYKELIRMQNEFLANVTHDLRTPIHAMKLAVSAILEGAAGPVTNEQNKMLSLAGRNVERLARLIDDLLDMSKLEAGLEKIHPQVTELAPLMRDAAASFKDWAKSRGVVLLLEDPRALPPVFADNDRLLQVITNLVSNAIKFTPSGGRVTLRAEAFAENEKEAVRIDVEDTGPGIPRAEQERVFQRFIQLGSGEKQDVRGTGLGLSICQHLVDLHKGRLWVESPAPSTGRGSRFSFTIPAVRRDDAPRKQKLAAPATASQPDKKGFLTRLFGRMGLIAFALGCVAIAGAQPNWGTVRRVLSGDEIQLRDGTRIRYLGIDAPRAGTGPAIEALAANRRLVEGREVRLEYGIQQRTPDGTWMAYVFAEGIFVNENLVRNGFALVAPLAHDEARLPRLLSAERAAQRGRRGLWRDTVLDPYPVRAERAREQRR